MTEKVRRMARRIYKLAEDMDSESELIYEKIEDLLPNEKTKTDLYDALEALTSNDGRFIRTHSSQIKTDSILP